MKKNVIALLLAVVIVSSSVVSVPVLAAETTRQVGMIGGSPEESGNETTLEVVDEADASESNEEIFNAEPERMSDEEENNNSNEKGEKASEEKEEAGVGLTDEVISERSLVQEPEEVDEQLLEGSPDEDENADVKDEADDEADISTLISDREEAAIAEEEPNVDIAKGAKLSSDNRCGDNATWEIVYSDSEPRHTLIIHGSGDMYDYGTTSHGSPYWDYLTYDIDELIVEEGITRIGNCAFDYLKIKKVTLPDSLQSIGYHAFYMCSNLRGAPIGDNVKSIEEGAFCLSGLTAE